MSHRTGRATRAVLALAVLVQLVVLYAPAGTTAAPFPHADKVVHVAVFLVPVALAVLVTCRAALVAAVFVAHAAVSEVVQATLLPLRSGDPRDALADVVGVGLGVLVAHLVTRWWRPGATRAEAAPDPLRGREDLAALVVWCLHRGARTHGRVRRCRRARPRPIPPGAPVTPSRRTGPTDQVHPPRPRLVLLRRSPSARRRVCPRPNR